MRQFAIIACLPFAALVSTAALAAEPAAAPAVSDRSQEIVCRKEKETGSLVKSKKTCHSRAQWAYIDDTNQQQTRSMADDMRTRSGGN